MRLLKVYQNVNKHREAMLMTIELNCCGCGRYLGVINKGRMSKTAILRCAKCEMELFSKRPDVVDSMDLPPGFEALFRGSHGKG